MESEIRSKNGVIVGLCRNSATWMPSVIRTIEKVSAIFSEHRIIVFENGSTDQTRSILEKWARECVGKFSVKIMGDSSMVRGLNGRVERITAIRNLLLDEVDRLEETGEFCTDYVLMCDFDNVFAHSVGHETLLSDAVIKYDDWNALFPVSDGTSYYDIWALRMDEHCENGICMPEIHFDCWSEVDREKGSLGSIQKYIERYKIDTSSWQSPVRVVSAFNGAGLYKWAAIQGLRYAPRNPDARCEHVLFNKSIENKFIIPTWKVHG